MSDISYTQMKKYSAQQTLSNDMFVTVSMFVARCEENYSFHDYKNLDKNPTTTFISDYYYIPCDAFKVNLI